eukprot:CAMPEP_0201545446 /NCGR_PEP_ID=MMETSP0173_2-20130828/1970_1 /ASSEMBLY_ACC=CAM_ASM_000268 /TAXON_ID=218659 /ORGANISM="Vexillifera sp., Strain DIVA3 564/2" /LENGTH=547 /DNA_ID=CAMNT_0047953853 /DNA_START=413 /DNA_END=2056 /DNA_ORIENTATION=-
MVCLTLLTLASLNIVRRRFWEVFRTLHWNVIGVFVGALLHRKGSHLLIAIAAPLAFYAIDLFFRVISTRFFACRAKHINFTGHITETVQLHSYRCVVDARGVTYMRIELEQCSRAKLVWTPGDWVFIGCRSLPRHFLSPSTLYKSLELHPFSLANSCSENGHLVFYIVCNGQWTRMLHEHMEKYNSHLKTNLDLPPHDHPSPLLASRELIYAQETDSSSDDQQQSFPIFSNVINTCSSTDSASHGSDDDDHHVDVSSSDEDCHNNTSSLDTNTSSFDINTCSFDANTPVNVDDDHRLLIGNSSSSPPPIRFTLEGPYGNLTMNCSGYHHVVLLAGGIGVGMSLSLLQHLRALSRSKNSKIASICVLWSIRELSFYKLVASDLGIPPALSNDDEPASDEDVIAPTESWTISVSRCVENLHNAQLIQQLNDELFRATHDNRYLVQEIVQPKKEETNEDCSCEEFYDDPLKNPNGNIQFHCGRLDITRTFAQLAHKYQDPEQTTHVAVLCCGPNSMQKECITATASLTRSNLFKRTRRVLFDTRVESFEL